MITLSEKVREILNTQASINSKVKILTSAIDKEILLVDKNLEELTNIYVQREIAGDTENLKEVEKSIDEAVQSKEKLKLKKRAYERAALSDKNVTDGIPEVLKLARVTKEERYKSIEAKQEQIDKLNEDIEAMQNAKKNVERERDNLVNKSEERELKPLLKYIEKREIKHYSQESYLMALLDGATGSSLDQYIESPVDNERPGPQNICTNVRDYNITVNEPRPIKPRQVQNICTSEWH